MWFPHRHQAGAGVLSLQWPVPCRRAPRLPSPLVPPVTSWRHDDRGRVRHGTRPRDFQRPVFSSVQIRVYCRSTSGGRTAKVKSFASTSAGG